MKKIFILILLTCVFSIGLFAQTFRVAYINKERIINEANDAKEAHRLFQMDRQNWERQVSDITKEIEALETQFETMRLTLSESGRNEFEDRIRRRYKEREQLVESILGDRGLATRRNEELLAPIMEKLRGIIDRIALDEGFAVIFDASATGIIWAQERLDITAQVIAEMNKER